MIRKYWTIGLLSIGFMVPAHAQIEKLASSPDIYLPPAIAANHISELSVVIAQPNSDQAFSFIENKYNKAGQLVDSVDQSGDRHLFAYDGNGRLKEYTYQSESFEFERKTGQPQYHQSKQFTYNGKGKLTQVRYYQMDSLSHTVNFALDKKGRTRSYHSMDQFGEPTFMGYYTYTKFDSVASFTDYEPDSTAILSINYTYDKKKKPTDKVEKSLVSEANSIWAYRKISGGDSTFMQSIEPSANAEGLEILILTRQILVKKIEKGVLKHSTWEYYVGEVPVAEANDMPNPRLLDRMIGHYENGKCVKLEVYSDGEPNKVGTVNYNEKGLISQIDLADEATGEILFTVKYNYSFFD